MNFKKLDNFLDSITRQIAPGNAVCVYKDGKKVHEYASGYADIEKGVPFSADKLIYLYSCSKVMTVTAALQLLEKGVFLLDDPISYFAPEFAEMTVKTSSGDIVRAKNQLTFRHLFTMTAGFDYDLNSPAVNALRRKNLNMPTAEFLKEIAKLPLSFEPGERWQYSLCHDVLAGMVEKISGEKFSDYVKKNICEPLGIEKLYYHLNPETKSEMAQQYIFVDDNEKKNFDAVEAQSFGKLEKGNYKPVGLKNDFILGSEYDSGGAGVITSVGEYAKFVNALANGGQGETGERILSDGTVKLLKTNQLNKTQMQYFNWTQLKGYGYGLGVRTLLDIAAAGTTGNIGEFGWGGAAGATVLADTENKLAVFYSHHMLNPQEPYYQPRLRNIVYSCL